MHSTTFRLSFLVLTALAAASAPNYGQAGSDGVQSTVKTGKPAVAVFAGGCFWGVEAVFEELKGVGQVTSGYTGGTNNRLPVDYDDVSSGRTGHAEAVRVEFDPSQISYGQLLKVFFTVAHDPTQLNRQGPDVGTQYRSAIFYDDAAQQKAAKAFITQLEAAKVYPKPIVTQVVPLRRFYQAEQYHQDYMRHHPNEPYIVHHDAPKLVNLKKRFPELLKDG